MKKLIGFAVVVVLSVFSIAASASIFTLDQLEQAGSNYHWMLAALGLLCFIELRKRS